MQRLLLTIKGTVNIKDLYELFTHLKLRERDNQRSSSYK